MAKKPKSQPSILREALTHVMLATKHDHDYGKFCRLHNNYLLGYDGVIACGHRIPELLNIAVVADTFKNALDRVGSPYGITAVSDTNVVCHGERLRVNVPAISLGSLPGVGPDDPITSIDHHLLEAMAIAASLTTNDKNAGVVESSIVLSPDNVYACNGKAALKVSHPCRLHGWYQVPKEALNVVARVKQPVTHIGFSNATITFWFGPDCWLRSNLYGWNFPNVDQIIERGMADAEFPVYILQRQLHDAVDKLGPFVQANRLRIVHGQFKTEEADAGAKFEIDHGLPDCVVPYDSFLSACLYGDKIRFTRQGNVWAGPRVTGAFVSVI